MGISLALASGENKAFTQKRIEGGTVMPTDPNIARALGLQLRSTKRKHRRPRWRSGWTALLFPLLILSILALFYVMMPSNDAVEKTDPSPQKETILQGTPVLGSLAGP